MAGHGNNGVDADVLVIFDESEAELGQFDEALRCISEALIAVQTTNESWYEAISIALPEKSH